MSEIRRLAWEALRDVNVTIEPPYGFPGVWETGEYAYVKVRIRPRTAMRDVVGRLYVWGAARVSPLAIGSIRMFEYDFHWNEIEYGDEVSYVVRLRATRAGTVSMRFTICGETIPFSCAEPEHGSRRTDTVYG
ncbi:MAG: hypothetical protein ACXAEF_07115 [Candidatus Thorarchaeota archaeon]|jgi:hypothetical protein